jgi:exodeoxyribonuclease VII small subunit
MSFEKKVHRLEEIVRALESKDLSLEKGLKLFEEGIACLRDASAELSKAEAAVQVLRERTDGVLEATDLRA